MSKGKSGLMTMTEGKAEGALQLFDILDDHVTIHDRDLCNKKRAIINDFKKFLLFMKRSEG